MIVTRTRTRTGKTHEILTPSDTTWHARVRTSRSGGSVRFARAHDLVGSYYCGRFLCVALAAGTPEQATHGHERLIAEHDTSTTEKQSVIGADGRRSFVL